MSKKHKKENQKENQCKSCEEWINSAIFLEKNSNYFTCKTSCYEDSKNFELIFENGKEEICRLQLDDPKQVNGLINFWDCKDSICLSEQNRATQQIKKCDFLFVRKIDNQNEFCFVELKGKEDVLDALKQIYCSILFFKEHKLLSTREKIIGFIVGASIDKDKKYQAPNFSRYQLILSKLKKHSGAIYQKPVDGGKIQVLSVKLQANQSFAKKENYKFDITVISLI